MNKIKTTFRALSNPNFRLFAAGQVLSLTGTWMQQLAMGWLVYRLTHSSVALGLYGFVSYLPTFVFTPFGGAIADRWNRHRVLIITQILAMAEALLMAYLTLSGQIQMWQILLLGFFLGVLNAGAMPVQQAFIVDMLDKKEDTANAIALNASMVNMARLVGPAIAGLVVAWHGEGLCFLLNGLSYIAVILSLALMKVTCRPPSVDPGRVWDSVKEGFHYSFSFLPIRVVLILMATLSLAVAPTVTMMPVLTREMLHRGADIMGMLMASSGIGAMTGAIYLASRRTVDGLSQRLAMAMGISGLGLMAFSLSHTVWLSALLMVIMGFGMMVQMAASNIFLQTVVDEAKRGRVMSIYIMSFMGLMPFGSLLAGYLINHIGLQETLILNGLACLTGSGILITMMPRFQAQIRPLCPKADPV